MSWLFLKTAPDEGEKGEGKHMGTETPCLKNLYLPITYTRWINYWLAGKKGNKDK